MHGARGGNGDNTGADGAFIVRDGNGVPIGAQQHVFSAQCTLGKQAVVIILSYSLSIRQTLFHTADPA